MARTSFLRPLTAFFLLGVLPVGAACNGRVVSLGDTGDTLQPVTSVSKVAAPPVACPAGWAHPNVCCTAGPSSGASCGAWEENPFRACEKGSTTYPDPLSCCSLTNPKDCTDTPGNAGPVPQPPPAYGCGYTCPPGWWTQASGAITPGGPEGPMCCSTDSGGTTQCQPILGATAVSVPPILCGTSGGPIGVGPNGGVAEDAGPAPILPDASIPPIPPTVDAGTPVPIGGDDAGFGGCTPYDAGYPSDGYDGGPASLCGACPTGWGADSVQPELCCQDLPDGTRLCFSQATGSASGIGSTTDAGISVPPTSTPGSPPSSGWGTGGASTLDGGAPGPSCTGSDTTCSCDNTINGHTYALDCAAGSSGAIACTCTIDGVAQSTGAFVSSCQDSSSVESAYGASGCGFP